MFAVRPPASVSVVPDELLLAILWLVPTEDLARGVQAVSRRFHRLSSEPRLWLARCRGDFAHWAPEKRALLDGAAAGARRSSRGPWQRMWLERKRADCASARHFEHVLVSKTRRLFHLECICRRGLDAKDFLLAQCRAPDGEDVLARRYYANKALSSIHRSLALEVWAKVQTQLDSFELLERALAAFDMFVLNDGEEDMDEIDRILDRLAAEFRAVTADLADLTTRQTALTLVHWVRAQGLVGLPDAERTFRNVRNCLIGHALTDPEHPSLPIVSSVIYAGIARRLGLRAYCSAVPGHVYTTVLARPGETVDGTRRPVALLPLRRLVPERRVNSAPPQLPVLPPSPTASIHTHTHSLVDNGERMFLDPYSHEGEVRLETLRSRVVELVWGGLSENPDRFLLPAPTSAIVLRVALNLEASHTQAQLLNPDADDADAFAAERADLRRLRRGDPDANLEALRYATVWAAVLMRPPGTAEWQHWLDRLLARLTQPFSEDVWLAERFLVPLYQQHEAALARWGERGERPPLPRHRGGAAEWKDPRILARLVHNLDRRLPVVSRRYTQEICARVRFRVGQVVRHRRYRFVGIINGWMMNNPQEQWDGVEEASQPKTPRLAYYSCLRAGVDRQVVDDANVELVTDPADIPPELFFLAGQSFKRFDAATCTFVSNIREFFPDD